MQTRLTEKQKKYLRQLAHKLKPVVIIGDAGLSENVLREIELSIEHHELIKVRIQAADREERTAIIEAIEQATGAETAQRIGHVAAFYRSSKKHKITLP